MSLEIAVAVPFRQEGTDRLGRGEFVVALSLDRDWFSPDQAKRLVDIAQGRGLLAEEEGALRAQFEPSNVEVPEEFVPDESILREQSTFERVLDALTEAGVEKRDAVASINERQRRLGVANEAAAILVAREHGIQLDGIADRARSDLVGEDG
ncbi:hypothetical protein AArcSl_2804 [Halalkaliarchaeum desulfuricum]|uniref:DUF2240 family protein n=1 Tax=Halalkaliarchaeum desulfuricum TaxID=2055893 RepID=A0A343TMU7_9EURY|nr:DUF2240 family protein [Halalkaliarchaeum desulfuricum]AUX10419.1 hypothetical protein AArcSl_2804 [Halalkaliarchaeum desulfuricum]